MKRVKTGRVKVPFEALERFAQQHRPDFLATYELTRASSVWRCKSGLVTVCLRYKGTTETGFLVTATQTIRNVSYSHG